MQNVSAKVTSKQLIDKYGKDEFYFSNPTDFPDPAFTVSLHEPFILGTIIAPGINIIYLYIIVQLF